MKFSSEQKQRLTLARAIYFDPPVLIFLDANSERIAKKSTKNLYSKKTVTIVAKSLVAVACADCIYVVENGWKVPLKN